MTVTNAAAIVARNPETGAKSSTLDLGLDSIVLLRRQGKFSVKNMASASRFRGWLENSPSEGERWLRNRAQDGDLYAMEGLGQRLLTGEGLPKSVEEGLAWLKKSAELGNPFAMEKLAEYELDENDTRDSSAQGERWLRSAVASGHRLAMLTLGTRLITGEGLAHDPNQGEQLLREAAAQGSQIAMIKLGTYLLSGSGLNLDREEGLRWLRRAGATTPSQVLELGLRLYQKYLTATTKGGRRLAGEAGALFQEAFRQGSRVAALNLAYLVRRGEIADARYMPLDELLSEHLKQNDPFALVNQALWLAKGTQHPIDWKTADMLFKSLTDSSQVLQWWFARSQEGDPEGHLVTGWLGRHDLAVDPDGLEVAQRMDFARKGGWLVPEWMNHRVTARQRR